MAHAIIHAIIIIIIIINNNKRGRQCKAGKSDLHPISPKTPAPQYWPIVEKTKETRRRQWGASSLGQ